MLLVLILLLILILLLFLFLLLIYFLLIILFLLFLPALLLFLFLLLLILICVRFISPYFATLFHPNSLSNAASYFAPDPAQTSNNALFLLLLPLLLYLSIYFYFCFWSWQDNPVPVSYLLPDYYPVPTFAPCPPSVSVFAVADPDLCLLHFPFFCSSFSS